MKSNIFLFLIPLVITIPSFLSAESKSVVINEIAWMGTSVEGVAQNQWWRYEWLELRNASDAPVSLEGWAVELSREKLDFRIPLRGAISPSGYFLIGASDKIPNIDLNYKNLAGKFNNSGQRVVLKNSAGETVDEVDATKGWPAGDNESKATMERNLDFLGWHTSTLAGGTPKAQNSKGAEQKLTAQKLTPQKPSFNEKLEKFGFSSNSSETKKDISMSSDKKSQQIFNSTTLVALVLALGSSAAILALKKRVLRA